MLIQPITPWQTEKSIQKAAWIKVVWLLYPKINSWVYSFSTHNSIEFEFTIVTVANLRICSSLKRHKRSACATWFKRKVLNQGLEVHIKLLILSPWLRTFLIYSKKLMQNETHHWISCFILTEKHNILHYYWIIRGEIHHLSGVWKSIFRFLRNHDSGKKGIAFFLKPYNDVMHFIV